MHSHSYLAFETLHCPWGSRSQESAADHEGTVCAPKERSGRTDRGVLFGGGGHTIFVVAVEKMVLSDLDRVETVRCQRGHLRVVQGSKDLGGHCAHNAFAPLSQWNGWPVGRTLREILVLYRAEWGTGRSTFDRWRTSGGCHCCQRVGWRREWGTGRSTFDCWRMSGCCQRVGCGVG